MNIAVTGYSGTGATAVYNLLKEYNTCSYCQREPYEHIPFYTPNGLFDLEYKLLFCNNLHRSDEAFDSFVREMKRLYENDFGWMGGYNRLVGIDFMNLVYDFINGFNTYTVRGYWSYDCIGQRYKISRIIKDFAKLLLRKEIVSFGKEVVVKDKQLIHICIPTKEEFYSLAKIFVNSYMDLFKQNKNAVFDHLLMPSDMNKIDNYFDDNFRLIIVDRDIRDVYLYTKYIRPKYGSNSKYPSDVNEFGEFWSKLRSLEKKSSNKVMRIYFEDLVFDYDNTISKIEAFTGLHSNEHVKKGSFFDANKAADYVQLYMKSKTWEDETSVLTKYGGYLWQSGKQ